MQPKVQPTNNNLSNLIFNNAISSIITSYEQIRNIVWETKQKHTYNNDFSSLNCIERSSSVGLYDTVETFKCHEDD